MYSSLPLWCLFTAIIPNLDYRTTFFGQLKKPYDALRFLNFVLQEVINPLYSGLMHSVGNETS